MMMQSIFASDSDNVVDNVRAEGLTYSNTEVLHIPSKYVGANYKIYVDIPADYYQHPNKKYPALYLLDADYSFPVTKAIAEHLEDRNRMKEVFIIGIAYDGPYEYKLKRSRDYTPWHTKSGGYNEACNKISGGGPEFAEFLDKELIPAMNKQFRLNGSRTLVGHSFGGLFGSWLSITDPKLFNSYIIVSPSLWYKNKEMFQYEQQYAKTHKALPEKIYFGIGDKENAHLYRMVDDLNQYVAMLKSQDLQGLQIEYQVSQDQDHDTIFPTAVTHGLMYIYGTS